MFPLLVGTSTYSSNKNKGLSSLQLLKSLKINTGAAGYFPRILLAVLATTSATGWDINTTQDDSGELPVEIKGMKGNKKHLHVQSLDVSTLPAVDIHTYPSAPFLARVLCSVLTEWRSCPGSPPRPGLCHPGLSQGDDVGIPVGSLHPTLNMECVHLVLEKPYIRHDDGG